MSGADKAADALTKASEKILGAAEVRPDEDEPAPRRKDANETEQELKDEGVELRQGAGGENYAVRDDQSINEDASD